MLDLETALAKASKARVDLRDPIANYHKVTVSQLTSDYPDLPLQCLFFRRPAWTKSRTCHRRPAGISCRAWIELVKERPLDDWKTYLRWHLLHAAAPYLHAAPENESFAFYGTVLSGQPARNRAGSAPAG